MRPVCSYWLIGVAMVSVSPAFARQEDRMLLELHPAPGITARVVHESTDLITLFQPFGPDIEISDPGNRRFQPLPDPELTKIDIDLDGQEDLIIRFPGRPDDEAVQIIRYRPIRRRYEVMGSLATMQCGLQAPERDTADRTLRFHCTSDSGNVIESLRFDADGTPWLASRKIEAASTGALYAAWRVTGMFGQIVYWDRDGEETEARAYSKDGRPIDLAIRAERAPLYSAPSDGNETAAYLIRGDKVRVISQQDSWVRIAYRGKGKLVDRWVDITAFASPTGSGTQ